MSVCLHLREPKTDLDPKIQKAKRKFMRSVCALWKST